MYRIKLGESVHIRLQVKTHKTVYNIAISNELLEMKEILFFST